MGYLNRHMKLFVAVSLLILSTSAVTTAIEYNDTIWIPVTFFDFRSNKSNPEFECNHTTGRRLNMAARSLPASKIPALGNSPYLNEYFEYWFVDWESPEGAKGIYTVPKYTYSTPSSNQFSAQFVYDGPETVGYDTTFENRVIKGSLPFLHTGNGKYKYENHAFFPLDTNGFGNEGKRHNYSFTMRLDTMFIYQKGLNFSFSGDDDVWVYIGDTLRMDIGGIHNEIADNINLDTIKSLEINKSYNFNFFYAERHSDNSHITIETNLFSPTPVDLDLNAEPSTTIPVNTEVKITSTIKDDLGNFDSIASAKTTWQIIKTSGNPTTVLNSKIGQTVVIKPTVAFDTIFLEGRYEDGDNTLIDTVMIIVTAGPDCKISIEAKDVDATDIVAKRNPQPVNQLTIGGDGKSANAYAIVRDCDGNYKRLANFETTEWSALPDNTGKNIITAVGQLGTPPKKYYGIISRITDGKAYAVAKEGTLQPDSVLVYVDDLWFLKLRLVETGKNVITQYQDSILMNTDEKRTFYVWGLLSNAEADSANPASWRETDAVWTMTDTGLVAQKPPSNPSWWTIDPKKPGKDNIVLTKDQTQVNLKLDVPITFVVAAPSKIPEFVIITPPPERIAGATIKAYITIENTDGLVPGEYCFGKDGAQDPSQAVYQDILGRGGERRPVPQITVDGDKTDLNTSNSSDIKNNQCFYNGIDTVEFILYYAPYSTSRDSMHQFTVTLNSNLTAKTEKFFLLPDSLFEINQVDRDTKVLDNPITLDSRKKESITITAVGYDLYGNFRGQESVNWKTDGTLDPIDPLSDRGKSLFINTDNVIDTKSGTVCASEKGKGGKIIIDCRDIQIIGQGADVRRAYTRDINGNGYLDRIDIVFSKDITLSNDDIDDFAVRSGADNHNYKIDSIVKLDTCYSLYLSELVNKKPQTAYTLTLSINDNDEANNVDRWPTIDGAPPVIWSILKQIDEARPNDRKYDLVKITFSEKVYEGKGSGFLGKHQPDSLFNVWYRNAEGIFTEVNLLEGIKELSNPAPDVVTFYMDNNNDLTISHWINIRDVNKLIGDVNRNLPTETNQKVNVNVSDAPIDFKASPNPMTPGFDFMKPGQLNLSGDIGNQYRQWAKSGQGVVLNLQFTPPNDSSKVYAYLKIYDVVGNIVNYVNKFDIMKDLTNKGIEISKTRMSVDYYWPGSNVKGMKVAPGVYKCLIILDYESSKYAGGKVVDYIGVGK